MQVRSLILALISEKVDLGQFAKTFDCHCCVRVGFAIVVLLCESQATVCV